MRNFRKNISALMIAFGCAYVLYDMLIFFTEKSYLVEINKCQEVFFTTGGPANTLPGSDGIRLQISGTYQIDNNYYQVELNNNYLKKYGFCEDTKPIQVWISYLTPTDGRLVGATRDWARRLGVSLFLIPFGFVAYFLKEKSE